MNAVNKIVAASEVAPEQIMQHLQSAGPQLGRRGFLALTGMA